MVIRCCWCGYLMGEKEPLSDTSITGSICRICHNKLENEIQSIPGIKIPLDNGEKLCYNGVGETLH